VTTAPDQKETGKEDSMTPNLNERPRKQTPQRLRRYLDIARAEGTHPAVRTLIRRKPVESPKRTPAFLRIARGYSA